MKKITTTRLRTSLVIITLATLSGCGLKGPLILEQVPVDQVQAPLENSTNEIPVEQPTKDGSTADSKKATSAPE